MALGRPQAQERESFPALTHQAWWGSVCAQTQRSPVCEAQGYGCTCSQVGRLRLMGLRNLPKVTQKGWGRSRVQTAACLTPGPLIFSPLAAARKSHGQVHAFLPFLPSPRPESSGPLEGPGALTFVEPDLSSCKDLWLSR